MKGAYIHDTKKEDILYLVDHLRVKTAFVTLLEKSGSPAFFHFRFVILKKIISLLTIGYWIYQDSVSKYLLNIFAALFYFFLQIYEPWYFWRFERGQPFLAKNTEIFVYNFFLNKGILIFFFKFKTRILLCSFSHVIEHSRTNSYFSTKIQSLESK